MQNPHILDWLFTKRTDHFVKYWFKESLGSLWHWYRYEYAVQRGSIHCHGVAKLKNDPGLCELTETALRGYLASKLKATKKDTLAGQQLQNINQTITEGKIAESTVCQYLDFCYPHGILAIQMRVGQNQISIHVKDHFFPWRI